MAPGVLADLLAEHVLALGPGPRRLAVDGPPWSLVDVETPLRAALAVRGRGMHLVHVQDFLRPASLRLERGRDDPDAFYESWLDLDALRREVLDPLTPGGDGRFLPALWDAERDRATRAGYVDADERTVVVVRGWFLLGLGLPFDLTVHLALSPPARRRRVPPDDAARELPAYDRYDEEARPVDVADVVVLADDPRRPAVIDRRRRGSR